MEQRPRYYENQLEVMMRSNKMLHDLRSVSANIVRALNSLRGLKSSFVMVEYSDCRRLTSIHLSRAVKGTSTKSIIMLLKHPESIPNYPVYGINATYIK